MGYINNKNNRILVDWLSDYEIKNIWVLLLGYVYSIFIGCFFNIGKVIKVLFVGINWF